MAQIGKMDSLIRDIIIARTRNELKNSIIEWINNRTSSTVLIGQSIDDDDIISKYVASYQYRSIEFLLSYLDRIYHTEIYESITSLSLTYLYSSATFRNVIDIFTIEIIKKYDGR